MRLLAFESAQGPTMGAVEGDRVVPLAPVDTFFADIESYVSPGDAEPLALDAITQVPPVPASAKVLCVGLNYPLHIAETKSQRPDHPNLFARWTASLAAPEGRTPVPAGETGLDWEAELAIVIGSELSDVAEADAMAGVFGYTCFNDISSRWFQRATSQWALGKNGDASGPIGPVIVTADEIGDPYRLRIMSRYNGETMQDSNTGNMIFSIAQVISYASRALTLKPGDVIATGTPDGVGSRREPPVLMTAGDVIEVEIEDIGTLRTHIV